MVHRTLSKAKTSASREVVHCMLYDTLQNTHYSMNSGSIYSSRELCKFTLHGIQLKSITTPETPHEPLRVSCQCPLLYVPEM
jgi:hypothetical protein